MSRMPAWLKAERRLFNRKHRRNAAPKPARDPNLDVRVDYARDRAAASLPAEVKDALTALSMDHTATRQQLDILRQTRGQRQVGTLQVPAHLRTQEPLSDAGVEPRGTAAIVLGPKE